MYNTDKDSNLAKIQELVSKGYKDVGWANSGAKFSKVQEDSDNITRMNCSMFAYSGSHRVVINHTIKEILHYDCGD